MNRSPSAYRRILSLLVVATILLAILSTGIGRFPVPPSEACRILLSRVLPLKGDWESQTETVLLQIRLPRIGAALLIGTGLAVSGAAYQGIFHNPLVSPYILGVAAGSGFGAALALLLSLGGLQLQIVSALFGLLAVGLTYGLGRLFPGRSSLMLVLAGILVSSFFEALISLIKYCADPDEKLPAIVFWLMGSLARIDGPGLLGMLPIFLPCLALLYAYRWRLNLLAFGEEEARAHGISVERDQTWIVLACTALSAVTVCHAGIIGWVGLVIPHVGRFLIGADYRRLLPVSALLGASFLLLVDDFARTFTAGEIPLGILTALLGAPFFALLLWKNRGGWS
jgi:iron complex transport system permease protein